VSLNEANISIDKDRQQSSQNYSIHLVNSRERALDVLIFRHGNLFNSLEEFMEKNPQISRDEALKELTKSYDDLGKEVMYSGGETSSALVQFFCLWNKDTIYNRRTHRVVGSVDGHKQVIENAVRENECLIQIELKNLRVHDTVRRKGIGKALIEAIQEYARNQLLLWETAGNTDDREYTKKDVIVFLQFDSDNHGAIRLYQDCGFIIDSHDQNRMNWSIVSESRFHDE
jgi:GNAT superfamily N-acetyltransferase